MSNLKYKLEALLFSSAREMTIEELCALTKATTEEVKEKLNELKQDYEQRDSSISFIDGGDRVKLNVKSEHAPLIHQVVTETELSKTLMETLAIIAFKYPIKQSDLIKLRTNKAYDHLKALEEMGYIIRQKFGRTRLIKLTPKFFEYFDLPEEKLKEKFADFGGIAKAIKEKESEIKQMKEEMKKKAEEAGEKTREAKQQPEIDLIDKEGHKEKLEVFDKTESEKEKQEAKEVKPYTEKIGNLEVEDIPEREETEEPTEETETTEEGSEEEPKETKEETPKKAESEVDEAVEKMLHPEKKKEEPKNNEPKTKEQPKSEPPLEEKYKKPEEEPKDLLEAAAEEEKNKQK